MITSGREVPDPAQSTWAGQVVQEPEKVGSGLTAGVETVAAGCDVVAIGTGCDVVAIGTGCDVVALGTGCDVVPLGTGCDVVALGTRELITWSRERPSQLLLRTKSCSTFWVP
ncbi:MAG: hypothetical protein ACXWO3_10370, partial [Isosphaeraceae bacterium]